MSDLCQPHLVYIGTDKCASTWLWRLVVQHPDVSVPALKDPFYFDRWYQRGRSYYRSCTRIEEGRVGVDFSHDYLYSRLALQRIASDLPNVRILLGLRNPVDRAVSAYGHRMRSERKRVGFWDLVARHPEILERGFYSRHVSDVLEIFGRERTLLFPFEDVVSAPESLVGRIFNHAGLRDFSPSLDVDRNEASVPRHRWLGRGMKTSASLSRRIGAQSLLGWAKNNALLHSVAYRRAIADDLNVDAEVRQRLRELYLSDLSALGDQVGLGAVERWKASNEDA